MPNATQILRDQQVLEQLTQELLDLIPKRKMYKQSQQTTVDCTALYKNEVKFFAPPTTKTLPNTTEEIINEEIFNTKPYLNNWYRKYYPLL